MAIESSASSTTAGTTQKTLDELISGATIDDHQAALEAIAQTTDPIIQDAYAGKLAKHLGVNKTAVSTKLKSVSAAVTDAQNGIFDTTVMRALIPGLVDLVRDDAGNIRYLMNEGGTLSLADSWQDQDGTTYIPPGNNHIKFLLPNASRVMDHYHNGEDRQLFQDMIAFFKRFSYLSDEVWPIVVLDSFLTYLQDHPDVRYIPVLYFYAVRERGKSRTAKTFLAVSYRGLHLTDIRPANIFRFAQNFGATLFFDVTNLSKSAEKHDGEDILLGRFEKGCQVVRVMNPDKGPFADQTYYDIYGSTVVATNEPANDIFESRCLSIIMPNRPSKYENLSPEMGLPIKERLTAFRARMMNNSLPEVDPKDGISGRLWDICKPLFQLAQLVAPEVIESMTAVIQEMADQKVEDLKESTEYRIVKTISENATFDSDGMLNIPVSDIRFHVNAGRPEAFCISSQKLGKRIKALSIGTRDLNGCSNVRISKKDINVLLMQYGMGDKVFQDSQLNPTTTPVSLGFTGSANRASDTGTASDASSPSFREVVESGRQTQEPAQRERKVGWKKK